MPLKAMRTIQLPDRLAVVIDQEFPSSGRARAFFDEFLANGSYSRTVLQKCVGYAIDARESWNIRRAAILMVEHQMLKAPETLSEIEFVFPLLKLISARRNGHVPARLLRDGFTSTATKQFHAQLRKRLARLTRVHDNIRGYHTTPEALRDFIHVSKQDCKLTIARYLWTVSQLADRVLGSVALSRGLDSFQSDAVRSAHSEAERALATLPEFEANLIKQLRRGSQVFWAADSTPSEINSLVEYPLGTVVLAIKPPGSNVEIEIKRAGVKGKRPLSVVYWREGKVVPPSHHLQGGSMGTLLRFEATSSSTVSEIYRLVFGGQAPIPIFVSLASIHSIPTGADDSHIITYFTEREFFGDSYQEMRAAMSEALSRLHDRRPPRLPPVDLALTGAFLGKVEPAQAILCGTTSYRLDRLADYLGPNGPDVYFSAGLGRRFKRNDARRFADDLLEEILGCYKPPETGYTSNKQYIQAAFEVPENHARAKTNYSRIMAQIGKFWGLVLALGGFTDGESFVARNVGLKSVWSRGQWTTNIIFMDHDGLNLPNRRHYDFRPRRIVPGMWADAKRIFGYHSDDRHIEGEIELLNRIYRVDAATADTARRRLRSSLKRAYQRTLQEMQRNSVFRKYLPFSFAEQRGIWDEAVLSYLAARTRQPQAMNEWRTEMRSNLSTEGYGEELIDEYFVTLDENEEFLRDYAFVFRPRNLRFSRS